MLPEKEFALLRHQRVLHVPLYVCVSISYSSHKLCGAIAQRIRFGILDFFFCDKFHASSSV